MAVEFKLEDTEGFDRLAEAMEKLSTPGPIVDSILHGEGAREIKERIAPLIPRSGRKWSRKARPAASAMPGSFEQDNEPMAVTVAARKTYGYLYFPDDGSNTERHEGGQHFMRRGAEAASERILDMCVRKLLENFNGGN